MARYFKIDTGRMKVKPDQFPAIAKWWPVAPCGCCVLMPMRLFYVIWFGSGDPIQTLADHYYLGGPIEAVETDEADFLGRDADTPVHTF